MVHSILPAVLKVPFGKNVCPFCKVKKVSARSLAEHILEEVVQNVIYVCNLCSRSSRSRRRLRSDTHECWKEDKVFRMKRNHYTIAGIRTLLAVQGVKAQFLDQAIKKTDYRHPVPQEIVVDPRSEKPATAKQISELPALPQAAVSIGNRLLSLSGNTLPEPPPLPSVGGNEAVPALSLPTFVNKTTPVKDKLLGEVQFVPSRPLLNPLAAALGAAPSPRVDLALGDTLDFLTTSEEVAQILDSGLMDPQALPMP